MTTLLARNAAVLVTMDGGRRELADAGLFARDGIIFSIDLNTVGYAGALHDPVAATVFCAPQKARYTVLNGRVVAEKGQGVTVEMAPVIQAHNRVARQFAVGQGPT